MSLYLIHLHYNQNCNGLKMSPKKSQKRTIIYCRYIVSFNVHGITSVLKSLWNIFILNEVYQLKRNSNIHSWFCDSQSFYCDAETINCVSSIVAQLILSIIVNHHSNYHCSDMYKYKTGIRLFLEICLHFSVFKWMHNWIQTSTYSIARSMEKCDI